ncbi:MAG: lytic transglycosylase domain-containing protein [Candidatus Aenigmarchaeota archaeon]|nr:lytic transglycosylase domain-containing protein [Candidatus Aenigmarchaeota archaeon]
MLEKSGQISGNVNFEYSPVIKKYEITAENNQITVYDSISKRSTVIYSDLKIDDVAIKDSEFICFEKIKVCNSPDSVIFIKAERCGKLFESECYAELAEEHKDPGSSGSSGGNCPTKDEAIDKIVAEAKRQGIKPSIALAIATVESNLNHCTPSGRVRVNSIGGVGLMQLMPGVCDNPFDVNRNIECGLSLLRKKCESVLSLARSAGFKCTGSGSCDSGSVSCIYDCSQYGFSETYTGWDLALRGYNGWGCCQRIVDGVDCTSSAAIATRNYVNLVNSIAKKYTMYD